MLSLVKCLVFLLIKAEAMETNIGAVLLTANNRSLTYVTTNLSVNCNGEANYTYEDGEDLYFSCEKADVGDFYLSDHLHLEYYNAEGILLFQTKPRVTQHIFRSVLKSNNDKYYLDCIRTDGDTERKYRYRTNFYMKKRDLHDADHHVMTLSVDGQKLTVITNNGKSSYYYDDYLYRYIDGEVLNVTCRKTDKNMRGTLTLCNSYHDETIIPYKSPVVRSPLEGYISLNVSTTKINRKSLTFAINNSDIKKPIARLLFLSDFTGNGVRVRGLPRYNILYQYTNDLDKWTIEYEYSVNDTLNLTCISVLGSIFIEKQRFHWEFNGETSISAAFLSPTMMIIVSNKTFTKILDATHNGKTINCVHIPNSYFKPERVEIILRLKPGANSENIITSKTLSNVRISEKSSLLILGSSIGAVLVILGLSGVACWYLRTRRNTGRNIETRYGDFTYQNNSPTPQYINEYESQYNECYSEIASNGQTFYETPGSVENNIDPEDHYTEIDLKCMQHKLVVPSQSGL